MKPYIQCDECRDYIFNGEEFQYDEFFDAVFCCDSCHAEYFATKMPQVRSHHKDMYCITQDEIAGM